MTRRMNQLRPTLDSFNFWVAVAYLGLVGVVVALFFINQNTADNLRRTAADESSHASEIVANANARYSECVHAIPELTKINRFIRGVQELHVTQEQNALAILRVTPKSDPTYEERLKAYLRFKEAADKVRGVHFSVPTTAECVALRQRLLHQG